MALRRNRNQMNELTLTLTLNVILETFSELYIIKLQKKKFNGYIVSYLLLFNYDSDLGLISDTMLCVDSRVYNLLK